MREEDLPKHVRKRGKNALQYRRRFEGVKDSKAVFQRAMNSKLSDDASTVQAEAAQKTKVYELELRKRTSAHPDSFTENDIDTLAAELLKQKSKQLRGAVKAGSLYPPQIDAYEAADGTGDIHEQPVSEFLADEISGLDDFIDDTRRKYQKADPAEDLTPDEQLEYQVIMRARESLLKKRRQPPRYLSDCFHWYAKNRQGDAWETDGPKWLRRYRRFTEILQYIGDCRTDEPNVDIKISDGFEAYAEEMVERGKKGQTIKRDLAESIGCFNRVSKYFKLRWNIEAPEYTYAPAKEKDPLTEEEQEAFVASCLRKNDPKAAVLLAMLHGGMMPTEVLRLGEDFENSVVLTGDIPYLAIKEKTKTGSPRRRLIPIVLGVELLTEHLREGVQWLNSDIDPSTPSQTLSKRIRTATGNPTLSTHCLRHTWRTMADMAEIDVTHQAYIGGWAHAHKKAKFSDVMLRYGAKGLQRNKLVKSIQSSQQQIFAHLMHLEATQPSNVVKLRRK